MKSCSDFLGGPVVKTHRFPCKGTWVQACTQGDVAKKKKKIKSYWCYVSLGTFHGKSITNFLWFIQQQKIFLSV